MTKYIVLLRAVNVSGHNIIKMEELKNVFQNNDFVDVTTYIQSGNIVLSTDIRYSMLNQNINRIIQESFQIDVFNFILTKKELIETLNKNPFNSDLPGNQLYFCFLSHKPELDFVEKIRQINFESDKFEIIGDIIYIYLPNGASKTKLTNSFFEKKLKVKATTRNFNTMKKLLNLLEEI